MISMVRHLTVVFLLALTAPGAYAQRLRDSVERPQGRNRVQMEERFRERYGQVLKERLGLNDTQLAQLGEVNRRFIPRTRQLYVKERELRFAMREALQAPEDSADQDRVALLLTETRLVQRQRLELVEAEQRELTGFLSPTQQAKYLGMQEQLRRRIDEMRFRMEGDTLNADPLQPDPPFDGRRSLRRRRLPDR